MATPTFAQFRAKAGNRWTSAQLQAAYQRLYGQTSAPAPATPAAPITYGPPAPAMTALPSLPNPAGYVNAGYEAQSADIDTRLRAQPGIYNPQRMNLADTAQNSLWDQGFTENTGGPKVDQTTPNGDMTYKLTIGPDGRLYRQQYQAVRTSQNARGKLFSSQTVDRTTETGRTLNAARDQVQRGFGDAQTGVTAAEQAQATDLASARQMIQGQYADYRGERARADQGTVDAIRTQNAATMADWQAYQPPPTPAAVAAPARPAVVRAPIVRSPPIPKRRVPFSYFRTGWR